MQSYTEFDNELKVLETHLREFSSFVFSESYRRDFRMFLIAQHLKVHIRTVHEGKKDHICDSCGKGFPVAGKLKQHIHIVHDGRKDYKCQSCGKLFSVAGNLKQHINKVHESAHKL